MPNRITAREAASRWGLLERSVTGMCRNGKIAGAYKEGRTWYIPEDAEKPADGRVRSGAYQQKNRKIRKPLPVGISDYRIASTQYYYVDKTMLIKDFIDDRPMVSLFTRPRRFGKTLNMDMLRTFFEKTDEELERTAKLWKQIGYRDYICSIEEMSCTGCKLENNCRYHIIECCKEKGVETCAQCNSYPCKKMKDCISVTESFRQSCIKACTSEEYEIIHKAFFEKKRNLDGLRQLTVCARLG